jgi:hypothetical protein
MNLLDCFSVCPPDIGTKQARGARHRSGRPGTVTCRSRRRHAPGHRPGRPQRGSSGQRRRPSCRGSSGVAKITTACGRAGGACVAEQIVARTATGRRVMCANRLVMNANGRGRPGTSGRRGGRLAGTSGDRARRCRRYGEPTIQALKLQRDIRRAAVFRSDRVHADNGILDVMFVSPWFCGWRRVIGGWSRLRPCYNDTTAFQSAVTSPLMRFALPRNQAMVLPCCCARYCRTRRSGRLLDCRRLPLQRLALPGGARKSIWQADAIVLCCSCCRRRQSRFGQAEDHAAVADVVAVHHVGRTVMVSSKAPGWTRTIWSLAPERRGPARTRIGGGMARGCASAGEFRFSHESSFRQTRRDGSAARCGTVCVAGTRWASTRGMTATRLSALAAAPADS